jgi:RND family efflux transporter MFP subunit
MKRGSSEKPMTAMKPKLILLAASSLSAAGFYFAGTSVLPFAYAEARAESHPIVEAVLPRRAALTSRLRSNATLSAFEETDLFAKVPGYLSEVKVDIGDHVKAGQVLAVIDIPETEKELRENEAQLEARRQALNSATRQVERAKADLALQQVTFKRQEYLNKERWASDQALDEIRAKAGISQADLGLAEANRDLAAAQVDLASATVEKTKVLLAYAKITAPFDGVVAQRLVNRGDLVQAATSTRASPLFKLERIDIIRVFSDVPENDAPYVHVGGRASVKPIGLVGDPIKGTVTRFAFRLDPETRNMRTEIDLPNLDERLYPGMYAEVSLELSRAGTLTVPASAIGSDSGGTFVYTVKDGRIGRVSVKTGISDGGRVEVIAGLPEDAAVVVSSKQAPSIGATVQVSVIPDQSANLVDRPQTN